MSNRPTIKSIARDLGISHMTVSRALSKRGSVSDKTREAVLNHARSVGYVKSAAAETMRGGSTRIIGLLLPNIVNEYYARLADRMADACRTSDHHLIIHITNDDREAEAEAFERLVQLQAAGIAYVPAPGPALHTLSGAGPKCVQIIRRRETDTPEIFIGLDDGTTIAEATRYLADSGCRKIAMVAGARDLSTGRARQDAFFAGLDQSGLGTAAGVIIEGRPSIDLGRRAVGQALEDPEVTGMVCGGFEISNGAVSAYMEISEAERRRFKLVGYGDPVFYTWLDGGITTINPPVAKLADRALECLVGTEGPLSTPESLVFATDLILRNSSA